MDYRALVERINVTFDYECALMGLGGGGGDPASQINVLRSSEELHQWFPLQKTPSTDWEARIDSLMDAQMRTLDFAQRKKCFDEVQVILAEELPMIYTVAPFAAAAIRVGRGQPPPRRPEPVPPDLESGGAVFQEEVIRRARSLVSWTVIRGQLLLGRGLPHAGLVQVWCRHGEGPRKWG